MNVLRHDLRKRVFAILAITLLFSWAAYFLEFTDWAESIRQAMRAEQPGEARPSRGYAAAVGGSLLKACLLIGIPLTITLAVNKARILLDMKFPKKGRL